MSRYQEFAQGACDMLPMLLGAVPFGIIFGSLAQPAGLNAEQTMGMSLLVFAGSAQFIALNLLGSGASFLVLVLTTLVVNLRHALYSASMQPQVRHLPMRWRIALAFGLTDEVFAVTQARYAHVSNLTQAHWYFAGAALAMYLNWQLCTALGLLFGQMLPNIGAWGLDFAMLATFIGIVVPSLKTRPQLAAALVAGALALAGLELPYQLGLLLAAAGGIACGLWLESRATAK